MNKTGELSKKDRKIVREALAKALRDAPDKHTPIENLLTQVANQFFIQRSDVIDAISKDENDNPEVVPSSDAWPFPKSS